MRGFLHLVGGFIRALFMPRSQLAAENMALRQQLLVMHRRSRGRLPIRPLDRRVLSWLCRFQPSALAAIVIVRPETVARWHRAGFRRFWTWKSRKRTGRPTADQGLRTLIRRISRENSLWGAPRIHGELRMLGFTVSQSTVAKYMVRRKGPPSQSWRGFLKHQANGIAALDLFTVPTIRFDILYALVILAHGSRKILHIAVTRHPTSDWVARQIIKAFPWDRAPEYLLRDNDAIYGQRYCDQLRAMNIKDTRTAYRSPWQNAYVERVIGSIRRECLDHTIIWNARYLKRTLKSCVEYYNKDRTHLSLSKNVPVGRDLQPEEGNIIAIPRVNGLHHRYQRENV